MNSIHESDSIKRIIISEEEIREKVASAGKLISEKYFGKPLILVSILKGSFIFLSDLCRAIEIPCEIGFMRAKSYYSGTNSSGMVNITMDLDKEISGYHVIIVEDIIDTGRTLRDISAILKRRNPLSLEIVTLLDKPERRVVPLETWLSLFNVPDVFLVGYGLDCGEKFRNLPYIAEYAEK